MSKRVGAKFREGQTLVFCGTTDDPRDNGSQIVIINVRGRSKWTKLTEPEYTVQLPSGARVVRESELAPATKAPGNGGQPVNVADEHGAPPAPTPETLLSGLAATSGALGASRSIVSVRTVATSSAPPAAKPRESDRWPATPAGGQLPRIAVTSYRR